MYEKHTKHFLVANVTFHCVFLFIMLDTGWKNESTDTYIHTHNNNQKKIHPLECWIQKCFFAEFYTYKCVLLSLFVIQSFVCVYDFAFNAKPLSKYVFCVFSLPSYTIYNRHVGSRTLDNQNVHWILHVCCEKSSFKTGSGNKRKQVTLKRSAGFLGKSFLSSSFFVVIIFHWMRFSCIFKIIETLLSYIHISLKCIIYIWLFAY